ncbi:MAG: 5'/3'-nucleotidase SurE, partial [Gammaproteobacteria bacterium]|nr:5'/3'-nucleotidase SurE [Gammaproteobacteria bacterium]
DDGVYAPGLMVLYQSLKEIADIDVVAPDRNRSGASSSLTLHNPLRIHRLDNGFISVEGTPTDCVHLALTGLLAELPDLVVSGINEGANLGDDILYSGTVAAAIEGRFLGLPSIAISLASRECHYYETAGQVVKSIVQGLIKEKLPLGVSTILNVNVPDLPAHLLQGITVTRLGTRHVAEPVIREKDPRGHDIYWIGPPGGEADAGPGSDFYAVNNGKVSVTPLMIDFTHHAVMNDIGDWLMKIEQKDLRA